MTLLDIALAGPVTLRWLAVFVLMVVLTLWGFGKASAQAVGVTALIVVVLMMLSLIGER